MAEWWIEHLDEIPLVIVRCGYGKPKCRRPIGEVKSTGQGRYLAMSKNEHPEPIVDWYPLAAPTVAELEAEIAERESQILRYVGTGADRKIVFRRRPNLPRAVAPIECLGFYSCRDHGEVTIDKVQLAALVADTPGVKQTFWAHADLD